MRRRREHPGQLEIDFSIPAKDPLSVSEVATALKVKNHEVYAWIQEGKIGAITVHRINSDREEFRIPLTNFIHYLNERYGHNLYFYFPEADQLSVGRIAGALGCVEQHIHNLIGDGEFPHAINLGRAGKRTHWQIPIVDLVNFVNRNRVGAYC